MSLLLLIAGVWLITVALVLMVFIAIKAKNRISEREIEEWLRTSEGRRLTLEQRHRRRRDDGIG